MTLLQLSFAEDEDYLRSVKSDIQALAPADENWRLEATEGRMRSRCCGLIEVQNAPSVPSDGETGGIIGFLHRTVVEFLRTDVIWKHLTSLTSETGFGIHRALLSSSLSEMKAKPPSSRPTQSYPSAYLSMFRMLTYEELAYDQGIEDFGEMFQKTYLSESIQTMGKY